MMVGFLKSVSAAVTVLVGGAAQAAIVISPNTLAGGVTGAFNTATGNISVCSTTTCTTVGNIGATGVDAQISSSAGVGVFYVISTAAGRVARCAASGSTWTCSVIATALP